MNIYTSETEYLKTEVQRLRALVRAQQITIDKLEAQSEQNMPKIGCVNHDCAQCKAQLEQKRPTNCGTGYCSCIECVMEPPQRTWVGLTDEEKHEIELKAGITEDDDGYIVFQIFRLIEAKLKEKNFD